MFRILEDENECQCNTNAENYKLALELALIRLCKYEHGDSRAVSDDFVAMAVIHADANGSEDCVEIVRQSVNSLIISKLQAKFEQYDRTPEVMIIKHYLDDLLSA